ncbi:MAG TPA: hypothetical protein VIK86_03395, partial [Candidatus Paceibacterota bacterium]
MKIELLKYYSNHDYCNLLQEIHKTNSSNWFMDNIVGIIGIIVGGFIAYHLFFLSRKINLKEELNHRSKLKRDIEPLLIKIRSGISSKVELINVKKYRTHYPDSNNLDVDGYTYIGAELKALKFDGVEFFCGIKDAYRNSDGKLTLQKENAVKQDFNIYEAGVIPYKWIEHIDIDGDEYSYRPQFFVKFNG